MIIPGKVLYIKKACLDIHCSAGTMINGNEWVAAELHQETFKDLYPCPFDDITVKICLDGKEILEQSIAYPIEFKYMFDDSESETNHCLELSLQGLVDSHRQNINGIGEVSPMLQIKGIWIEKLSMRLALEEHGQCFYENSTDVQIPSEFMGQNGKQILKFCTPIYPWLLSIQNKSDYFY